MDEPGIIQPHKLERKKWSLKKRLGFFAAALIVLFVGFFVFRVGHTFSFINGGILGKIIHINSADAPEEKNRIDILIVGLRGEGDVEAGDNLTDTIMVLSIKTDTKKAALLSIPRDLYVQIPRYGKMEKINFAYAYGEAVYKDGLSLSTLAVEKATGINIDYAAAINFPTFINVIDALGGIDVWVPKDFSEAQQWGYEFKVPKGWNHFNSETALYYARSRYSTSDFDRARRQHDILTAVAKKATGLGVLANPVKLNRMLDSLAAGVKTDIGFLDMVRLLGYAKSITGDSLARAVLDDSENGLLVSGFVNSAYVLYPKAGVEDYTQIHALFQNIFK
ncbi:hypothetical protein A3C91_04815 [Candidatus Azambacteria bacterium RIFCSPHIGHO2_02_FULL_52_12]|uniref:Cell envelope-related transcriptional attenuator domain-containing protein n=1 Tax=Candidatus Azambacteria bacterium RIFCSPLOWO2_01_FULL_46_25 TaxID=1797298 RepID=A0A1F5BVU7_9BACT|nr:MAG: hypothetical protein A3C91_04815 [Candidatus Azambacteria bacterium RIFCSPHIGHO2_02_FULL_52_12]OGD34716.1 MAG: hypothetical protein A2988_04435 [Candidatus Azambacteria bacterium RIFCSPLOWO2_01_FULL_46_25]OGD37011.1 MAG: hypothetical protein A2850_03780 [Candidatus Azambacteria bacterium RIFCSPHIGHO2_01_FULL_51_74]